MKEIPAETDWAVSEWLYTVALSEGPHCSLLSTLIIFIQLTPGSDSSWVSSIREWGTRWVNIESSWWRNFVCSFSTFMLSMPENTIILWELVSETHHLYIYEAFFKSNAGIFLFN